MTIDGHTNLAFSEDSAQIFAAKGWNVLHIPNGDLHDPAVYENAVNEEMA